MRTQKTTHNPKPKPQTINDFMTDHFHEICELRDLCIQMPRNEFMHFKELQLKKYGDNIFIRATLAWIEKKIN